MTECADTVAYKYLFPTVSFWFKKSRNLGWFVSKRISDTGTFLQDTIFRGNYNGEGKRILRNSKCQKSGEHGRGEEFCFHAFHKLWVITVVKMMGGRQCLEAFHSCQVTLAESAIVWQGSSKDEQLQNWTTLAKRCQLYPRCQALALPWILLENCRKD